MNHATPFRLTEQRNARRARTIAVEGELDLYTAPQLEAALAALPPEVDNVLIDLTGVTFLDSTALGTLVKASNELRGRGGALLLAIDSLHIRRTFEVSGLDRHFAIHRSAQEAVRELLATTLLGSLDAR